jgi:hypothetical protein
MLAKDPKLAQQVLPKQAFTKPVSIANSAPVSAPSASVSAPASVPAPASGGSTH